MSETTNENINEVKVVDISQTDLLYTSEELKAMEVPVKQPAIVGVKSFTIEVTDFDNGQQAINLNTPKDTTVAENLGILELAKQIMMKDRF